MAMARRRADFLSPGLFGRMIVHYGCKMIPAACLHEQTPSLLTGGEGGVRRRVPGMGGSNWVGLMFVRMMELQLQQC